MKRRFIVCVTIVTAAVLLLGSIPAFSASASVPAPTVLAAASGTTAKKPAAPKTPVIPEIQTQCSNVLIQLEILPKPVKGNPKLSDKIKLSDFKAYVNNTMSEEIYPVDPKKQAKVTYVTFQDAENMLLTTLGYGKELEGKKAEEILAKASELGLSTGVTAAASKQITRGEAAVLLYNSLTVPFASANMNDENNETEPTAEG